MARQVKRLRAFDETTPNPVFESTAYGLFSDLRILSDDINAISQDLAQGLETYLAAIPSTSIDALIDAKVSNSLVKVIVVDPATTVTAPDGTEAKPYKTLTDALKNVRKYGTTVIRLIGGSVAYGWGDPAAPAASTGLTDANIIIVSEGGTADITFNYKEQYGAIFAEFSLGFDKGRCGLHFFNCNLKKQSAAGNINLRNVEIGTAVDFQFTVVSSIIDTSNGPILYLKHPINWTFCFGQVTLNGSRSAILSESIGTARIGTYLINRAAMSTATLFEELRKGSFICGDLSNPALTKRLLPAIGQNETFKIKILQGKKFNFNSSYYNRLNSPRRLRKITGSIGSARTSFMLTDSALITCKFSDSRGCILGLTTNYSAATTGFDKTDTGFYGFSATSATANTYEIYAAGVSSSSGHTINNNDKVEVELKKQALVNGAWRTAVSFRINGVEVFLFNSFSSLYGGVKVQGICQANYSNTDMNEINFYSPEEAEAYDLLVTAGDSAKPIPFFNFQNHGFKRSQPLLGEVEVDNTTGQHSYVPPSESGDFLNNDFIDEIVYRTLYV